VLGQRRAELLLLLLFRGDLGSACGWSTSSRWTPVGESGQNPGNFTIWIKVTR
jgi:hypothetical protein